MKTWDWVMAALCGLWVLALLWIVAPDHDVVQALLSDRAASWGEAIGSIGAVIAVLGLARWELERSRREALRAERDVVEGLRIVEVEAQKAVEAMRADAELRAGMGLRVFSTIEAFHAETERLTALTNRLLIGRQAGAAVLVLSEDLLALLRTRYDRNDSAAYIAAAASRLAEQFAGIRKRADEILDG